MTPAQRLTVHLSESDRHGHHALAAEVLHRAHAAGLAGATVLRGVSGYGASGQLHTSHVLSLSDDLPVLVVVVDTPERVAAFLPRLMEVVGDALVTVEDVQVVRAERP